MLPRILISLLIGLCLLPSASAQSAWPTYDQVHQRFFSRYNWKQEYPIMQLDFAKKKDGWWIHEKTYDDVAKKLVLKEEYLFWSASNKIYLRLVDFDEGETANPPQTTYDKYNYNRIPYYGYEDWTLDVMDDFGGQEVLGDTLLEALARAYSSYASGFAWGMNGEGPGGPNRGPVDRTKPLPEERLELFAEYVHRSIATYQRLLDQNPNYETKVGRVATKLANEYMYLYSTAVMAGYPKKALSYLPERLYAPWVLEVARDYLRSTEQDAIVFVNGDNDTYPLWYVQIKEGFRQDVSVVNLSLLNSSIYDKVILTTNGLGPKVTTKLGFDTYKQDRYDYAVFHKSGKDTSALVNQLLNLMSNARYDLATSSTGNKIPYFPTRNFLMKVPEGYVFKPVKHQVSEGYRISFIMDKRILFRGDIIQLDIIQENLGKRPVYIAISVGAPHFLGLDAYLQLEGLVYQIIPVKSERSLANERGGVAQPDLLDKRATQQLKWTLDSWPSTEVVPEFALMMSFNYRNVAGKLIETWIEESDSIKARGVLENYLKRFPTEGVVHNLHSVRLAKSAFTLGMNQEGKDIVISIAHYEQAKYKTGKSSYDSYKEVMRYLRSMAIEHNQDALVYKLDRQLPFEE